MDTNSSSKAFWRQIFILSSSLLTGLGAGIMTAFPAILNPVIMSGSDEIFVTASLASWIAAINGFAGTVGFLILPPFMDYLGRKYVQILMAVLMASGWITIAYAKSIAALLTGRILQGLRMGGFIISFITISEYTDPKRRGYFHTVKKLSMDIGAIVCHSSVLYMTWRQCALVAAIPHLIAIVFTIFWPESPQFLAMKGRFDECEKSYNWLHGYPNDKRELIELMEIQKEKLRMNEEKGILKETILQKLIRLIKATDFRKAFVMIIICGLIVEATGKHYFKAYIIDMMKEMVGDSKVALFCVLGADILICIADVCSSFMVKFFNRRSLMFSSGFAASLMLLLISLLVYLNSRYEVFSKHIWVIPSIVLFYIFITNLSVIPLCYILFGELFSLEHRGLGSCVAGMTLTLIYGISLRITPLMISSLSLELTFAIFAVFLCFCLLVLYCLLPETKDKALHDIEVVMKGRVKHNLTEGVPMLT